MVRSVYGVCEGYNIIFTRRGDTDLWDVDVPFERDGNYVVALYAVDYAGNESYYATVLFVVKRFCISVKIIDMNMTADVDLGLKKIDGVNYVCRLDTHEGYQIRSDDSRFFIVSPKITHYFIHAVRCEKCGGV